MPNVRKWLPSFKRSGSGTDDAETEARPGAVVFELMVVDGADVGHQFTVDGPDVLIGRGKLRPGQTGAIYLHDPTVSAEQATIRLSARGEATLHHNPKATNPTLVNGLRVKKSRIQAGDRIQMGRVVIEVRVRRGIALSGLFRAEGADAEPILGVRASEDTPRPQTTPGETGDLTEQRELPRPARGSLALVRGMPGYEDTRWPLNTDETLIGRSLECDVNVPEAGISRRHASVVWRDDQLWLHHLSATNATALNGSEVGEPRVLKSGDEIVLADVVVFRVDTGDAVSFDSAAPAPPPEAPPPQRSLREHMEDRLRLERRIEEEFRVEGSFVDVDVVGSYAMKAESGSPANIVVSFERFRAFVSQTIDEFEGQVLNSNGDELMCFFDSTLEAVRAASAVLARLDAFNREQNELNLPFRFRIGIHTGTSLVDRERGVAYSPVLDVAGHLQKAADVNGLLISEATMAALPAGLPFESAGTLEHEGIPTYRMTAPIP